MITIDGKTKTCGLLGYPVEHTMSPAIHNTLSQRLGINQVYVPFLTSPEGLTDAVKGAYELGLQGLNATVPHKSHVIPLLREIDPLAKQIGAVNTLVRVEGGYKGYNTDMEGLYRAMTTEGIRIEGEKIIILGAGGAARAVAFLCAFHQAGQIFLLNRSVEKARAVADEVNTSIGTELVLPMALSDYDNLPDEKMLAIQATSVGLSPNDDEVIIDDPAFYDKIHTGYDLIYRPLNTKFMRLVKEHGGTAFHGLKMLLYQGVIAYELWNNVSVSEEDCEIVYQAMQKAMGIEA